MVSKNNRAKRLEEVAERQSHFGIRKLTVGAASVLLGTTLWMGSNSQVAHASDNDNGNGKDVTDESHSQHVNSVDTSTAKKAVIEVEGKQNDQSVASESNSEKQAAQNSNAQSQAPAPQENTEKTQQSATKANAKSNEDKSAASVDTNAEVQKSEAKAQNSEQANPSVAANSSESTEVKSNAEAALKIQKKKAEKVAQSAEKQTENIADTNSQVAKTTEKAAENATEKAAEKVTDNNASVPSSAANANLTSNEDTLNNTLKNSAINGDKSINNAQKSDKNAEINVDLTKTGLDGKTAKALLTTNELNLLKSTIASLDNGNNKVDASKYSAKKLEQLLGASLVQDTSASSTPQNIEDVTPNFNLGSTFNRTIFNYIPETQTVYSADKDTTNGNVFAYSTDIADPGKTLYFWLNGQLVAQISGDASTGGATGTGNVKNVLHAAFSPEQSFNDTLDGKTFFIDRYSTTVGAYQYTKSIITSSDMKVYGISGDVKNTSSNFVWLDRQTGEVDTRLDYSFRTHWVDPAAPVNNKVKQTVWYVDEETGHIMGSKSVDALSGQSYNITDATPEKVTWNGGTYVFDHPSDGDKYDLNDAGVKNILNTVLETVNGIDKKVSDIINTPLQGTVSSTSIGDIVGISNNFQGDLIWLDQVIDGKGTANINAYVLNNEAGFVNSPAGIRYLGRQAVFQNVPGAVAKAHWPAGKNFEGKYGSNPTYATAGAIGINDNIPASQDIVLLYKKAPVEMQKADVIFVDDDNNEQQIPGSVKQNAEGASGTQITFNGAANQVINILGQDYEYVKTTGAGVTGGNTGNYTSVNYPDYDNDVNTDQHFVVHFHKKTVTPPTPTTPTYKATTEEKSVTRTINYYDKVTGQRIPQSVIDKSDVKVSNPVTETATFTRSTITDSNGKFIGYGTVTNDGKGYNLDNNGDIGEGWTVENGKTRFAIQNSPDLTAQHYTAPTGGLNATAETPDDGSEVESWKITPEDLGTSRVYNIYYGHETQPIHKTETVERNFHYIFTDSDVEGKPGNGSTQTYSKAPQTVT
ncbi:YSIRK-type signal peptide-containing protein, partial [Lactobacillus sp. PSON]|uniref:YSIRK-type signal peptide-containing protein n=1 Tax=Lactobacillus sp. PSON TaxID=3455454 RepID=UPI004041C430